MFVSAFVEGFLVDWRCFIERFFVIRNFRQSSINRLWDVVDNTRRVIRFHVDIERDVVRLVIWHVFIPLERLRVTSRKFTIFYWLRSLF